MESILRMLAQIKIVPRSFIGKVSSRYSSNLFHDQSLEIDLAIAEYYNKITPNRVSDSDSYLISI